MKGARSSVAILREQPARTCSTASVEMPTAVSSCANRSSMLDSGRSGCTVAAWLLPPSGASASGVVGSMSDLSRRRRAASLFDIPLELAPVSSSCSAFETPSAASNLSRSFPTSPRRSLGGLGGKTDSRFPDTSICCKDIDGPLANSFSTSASSAFSLLSRAAGVSRVEGPGVSDDDESERYNPAARVLEGPSI